MSETLHLRVRGMTCAHCAQSVENSLAALDGISTAKADFASGDVAISLNGPAPDIKLMQPAVKKAGFELLSEEETNRTDPASEAISEARRNLMLLVVGVILVAPVLIFHWTGLHGKPWDYIVLGLAVLIQGIVGRDFYKGAIAGIRTRVLGMDVLVSIGMATGLIYGAGLVLLNWPLADGLTKHVYLEAATLLVVFLRLGKYVEARARGGALTAMRSLLELAPDTARVRHGEHTHDIPIENVKQGDIVVVNAGERVGVDGEIIHGQADVDESMLTGEPVPVARKVGDAISAGTIPTNGSLDVKAVGIGAETRLARIVKMVEEAQRTKAPIQRIADRISNFFVPAVVTVALAAFFGWWWAEGFTSIGVTRGITHAIAVLVIACPCALGIAVPAAVMIGSGAALRRNILVKNGGALERMSGIKVVAFDKTGTLTIGRPTVQKVAANADEDLIRETAALVAGSSQHPFTRALGAHYGPAKEGALAFEFAGKGLILVHEGQTILFGNDKLLADQKVDIPEAMSTQANAMRDEGHSVSYLTRDGQVLGAFGFADELREQTPSVVKALIAKGIKPVLITGDHQAAAERIAKLAGIETVHAAISPEGKLALIEELKAEGPVCMVGDGINDAPALAKADVGVAIGGGSDVAKETGDIVLMREDLNDLLQAIDLSERTMRGIKRNLFLSLAYNVVGIPLAAGALVTFGVFLPPSYAALAMVFSDVSVAANSAWLAAELRK
ncbi:heavy metal translocating P-type ATPase [Planctomycetota bacterium]|nr:heavy metal translocating P-type ATPase [Planctomycetota bacterium]